MHKLLDSWLLVINTDGDPDIDRNKDRVRLTQIGRELRPGDLDWLGITELVEHPDLTIRATPTGCVIVDIVGGRLGAEDHIP